MLLDLSDMPEGTRFILCREPLHPGAQGSLFPSEHFRYWGHYTDATGDPVDLDLDLDLDLDVDVDVDMRS